MAWINTYNTPAASEPDLIAPGAQSPRSTISPEVFELGRAIYSRIVDEGDKVELAKFQQLAAASMQGVRPRLIVEKPFESSEVLESTPKA